MRRLVKLLPRGRTLPEESWLRRHRVLLGLLWLHAAGLTIFTSLRGYDALHSLGHGAVVAGFATMASLAGRNRRVAAALVSLGLMSSSALLVHSWGGVIEGHFHFFVMIALLALYEDWLPFLLAAAYVVIHHGLAGAIDPGTVYNHPDAVAHPWKWALIHGAFVTAAGAASVATWRLNENVRAETEEAYRQARENEERFGSAFEEAPIGMMLGSIEGEQTGRIIQVNRAMCELTGYSEEELVGKHFGEITHPDDLGQSHAMKDRLLAGEISRYQLAKRYVHRDGHTVWVQLNVSLLRDAPGRPRYAIAQVQDISDRKRATEEIQESQRQLAEALRLAHIGSWEWNIETGDVSWSDELYLILGLDPRAGGASYDGFFEHVHPDEREWLKDLVEACLEDHKPFKSDLRMVHANGEVRIVESHGELLMDDHGRPTKMVGTTQDVTERRHVEREMALREESAREHKARSEFLSRISHELRTPLNAILGFAQLLEMDGLQQAQHESVGQIKKGGQHLLELINEVLEISRIEAGNMTVSLEPVHVGRAVAEVLDLVEPLAAEHGVSLENRLEADDAERYVEADNQRLKQVLLNLLSNGIKYNRPGGSVRISLESVSPGRVLILVTDTGRGIPEDKLAKVFSPFDRLGAERTTIEGTGLGLTLSKLFVEAMGGTLGVESEPWIGSSFIVGLAPAEAPLSSSEPEHDFEQVPANGAGAVTATVLYVEDDLPNFKLAERILEKRPEIRLLPAMDGLLGLELARQQRPELILLDLHLPGMDGEELLRRLKDDPLTAEIPVVAVSADATSARVERVLAGGAEAFLTKPLDVTGFLAAVDEALRARVGA